jgi:hypothetical protein
LLSLDGMTTRNLRLHELPIGDEEERSEIRARGPTSEITFRPYRPETGWHREAAAFDPTRGAPLHEPTPSLRREGYAPIDDGAAPFPLVTRRPVSRPLPDHDHVDAPLHLAHDEMRFFEHAPEEEAWEWPVDPAIHATWEDRRYRRAFVKVMGWLSILSVMGVTAYGAYVHQNVLDEVAWWATMGHTKPSVR